MCQILTRSNKKFAALRQQFKKMFNVVYFYVTLTKVIKLKDARIKFRVFLTLSRRI